MEYSFTKEELKILSSSSGLRELLSKENLDFQEALRFLTYRKKLKRLQVELIKLQNWVVENDQRLAVLFEGGEFAGKGGAIRAFMEHMNPRSQRLVALPKPTEKEKGLWYYQRYVMRLPERGEIVFFDRSWYNRALVEPVNDFCTEKEYTRFMSEVNDFERMLSNDGIKIIKFYFSVSKPEQKRRIDEVKKNPLRRWELTPVDLNAQKLWDKYKSYEARLFSLTNSEQVPWVIIEADDKYEAQLNAIRYLIKVIPYKKGSTKN
jgi:polyphosphate kinase 2